MISTSSHSPGIRKRLDETHFVSLNSHFYSHTRQCSRDKHGKHKSNVTQNGLNNLLRNRLSLSSTTNLSADNNLEKQKVWIKKDWAKSKRCCGCHGTWAGCCFSLKWSRRHSHPHDHIIYQQGVKITREGGSAAFHYNCDFTFSMLS